MIDGQRTGNFSFDLPEGRKVKAGAMKPQKLFYLMVFQVSELEGSE